MSMANNRFGLGSCVKATSNVAPFTVVICDKNSLWED